MSTTWPAEISRTSMNFKKVVFLGIQVCRLDIARGRELTIEKHRCQVAQ